ncbi:hypothetical protein D9M68_910910 [compost metagenome]
MPTGSKRTGFAAVDAESGGRWRWAIARANRPSGTLIQNTAFQPQTPINRPPRVGPSAVPTADTVPSSPMALPAWCLGTRSLTRAMVSAIMVAAPRP